MSVLTVTQAKTHLNITGATHDTELQTFIDTAEAIIAKRVGPLESTSKTARVVPSGCRLILPVRPAISLTSVTPESSAALTLSDLYLDTEEAVVTYNSGHAFQARYYTVVYAAGRSTLPADLLGAVKELVRHWWKESQRGGSRRPGSAPAEQLSNTIPGAQYALPFNVEAAIIAHERRYTVA